MLIRIKNYNLQDITDGIKFLLDRSVRSPEVRQLALDISDKDDKISAIYDWVKFNLRYVPDPVSGEDEIELFISPIKQVRDYRQRLSICGDCDDNALLATALYQAIGIRSNVVIIDSVGNGFDHAFSQAWSDKLQDWVDIDPTSKYPLCWKLSYKDRIIVN